MLQPARRAAGCKSLTYDNTIAKTAVGWPPLLPVAEALRTVR